MAGHHLLVELREYIVTERFIWDGLIQKGLNAVTKVRAHWNRTKEVPRMLLAFPAEHLVVGNKVITDFVSFAIPDDMPTRKAAVELAKTTKAYALLLIERDGDVVRILLESHHGTRGWRLPIRRHGDVTVLEKEEATTDSESLGVLWQPRSSQN